MTVTYYLSPQTKQKINNPPDKSRRHKYKGSTIGGLVPLFRDVYSYP